MLHPDWVSVSGSTVWHLLWQWVVQLSHLGTHTRTHWHICTSTAACTCWSRSAGGRPSREAPTVVSGHLSLLCRDHHLSDADSAACSTTRDVLGRAGPCVWHRSDWDLCLGDDGVLALQVDLNVIQLKIHQGRQTRMSNATFITCLIRSYILVGPRLVSQLSFLVTATTSASEQCNQRFGVWMQLVF